jgi:Domain of unknown function (DUF2341)/Concanavalin A-like lectin/glucanases superfamily
MIATHCGKVALWVVCTMFFIGCGSIEMAGDTSQTGNTYIMGSVLDSSNGPANNAVVVAIPLGYNPVTDPALPASSKDTTGPDGRYSICVFEGSEYNIQAVSITSRTRFLRTGIAASSDTAIVSADTVRKPGTIKVVFSAGIDATNGYLYIPGTMNYSFLSDDDSTFILDSVSAGVSLSIYYAVKGSASQPPKMIRDSVTVTPGGVTTIEYAGWNFSKSLVLNTTASGASIAGTVTNFPVLVRFLSSNFNFSQARPGGEDIRFTKADGTPLPYEIERWDASLRSAEIWVKIDTIYGNDSTHHITAYWGNPNVPSASNSAAVFDTAAGFQGVWHLNDPVSGPVKDATINGYDGTVVNATAQASVSAMVGSGREFGTGDSGYVVVPSTAMSNLNFPENGVYAISAWVLIDTLDGGSHAIADKGDQQCNLEVFQNKWEFAEYESAQVWEMTSAPASIKQWAFVTGGRNQMKQYLFVNGQCVDSMIENQYKPGTDRNTGYNVMFGKTDGVLATDFPYYFHGTLDEIRMCNRAPSADWIKLCYMNQKADDQLIVSH